MADARWLASLGFDMAEWHHRMGSISDVEWDAYRHVWRTSAPRFSDIAKAFEAEPSDSETRKLVTHLKEVLHEK